MKYRLLAPGPTPVPEETLLELAKPVRYHRTPEARQILAEVLQDLQYVFYTRNSIMPMTISGPGAMECRTDDWHIDICVTGSQKALMLPPGLAFLSVSEKAWKQIEKNPTRRAFYFDLKRMRDGLQAGDTPYTMAHTLVQAL